MRLELLERKSEVKQGASGGRYSVLFVHGAGTSSACWLRFLDYFAAAGCDAYALSLRGHGKSESPRCIALTGCAAYVDDIRECVKLIDRPVVLVGHSWGGYVLQRYLERYHDSLGAVLIASAPPATSLPAYWQMFKMFPWLVTVAHLTARPHYVYSTWESIKALLYHPNTPDEAIDSHAENLEPISTILYLQTILRPPKANLVDTEILVIGGENDAIYSSDLIEKTGKAYGCTPVIIPNAGHMMMLESNWEQAAKEVLQWVLALPERH